MSEAACYYYVDEAGDGTLFDESGRCIVGLSGCSRYFVLGVVEITDPETLGQNLAALRTRLAQDPYLAGIPSMQPAERKTARCFHAKDDVAEVRWQVFTLLHEQSGLRFMAEVRDKMAVVDYVRQRNETDAEYRYHPNELYDHMTKRLFRNLLHKRVRYDIHFARRGSSDRTDALRDALAEAQARFALKWGITSRAEIHITADSPWDCAGLQVVDYLLWAVQRAFERGEDRYVRYMWHVCSLVHDIDDTRKKQYGVYYNERNPLTREVIEKRQRI